MVGIEESGPSAIVPVEHIENSIGCMLQYAGGRHIHLSDVHIQDTGTVKTQVFKVEAPVLIIDTWAEITEVTTLVNCTNVYADLWDGTTATDLTADGITLSGAPVGTFFTKALATTSPYSLVLADQARVFEPTKKLGQPFIVVPKTGAATTYIRFCYTTTDTPVDFKMNINFIWLPLNSGEIVLA